MSELLRVRSVLHLKKFNSQNIYLTQRRQERKV